MLNRKSALAGVASMILGVVIGGAGVLYLTDAPSHAETASFTQAEKDPMAVAMDQILERSMAQNQVEPPLTRGERAFMDFTIPDLSIPQNGEETTRHGCVKPTRPQWVIDRSPQEADNAKLLKIIYDRGRYQNIIQMNACPCEIEHPSWDEANEKYQEISAGMDRNEIRELGGQTASEVANLLKPSLDICREWRGH